MSIIEELKIKITDEDYNRLFRGNNDSIKRRVIYYNSRCNIHDSSLPARFLEITRDTKKSKYPCFKDKELWENYCAWCDIVLNKTNALVIIMGGY